MAEITRDNPDFNAVNLLKVVNQVLLEARKKLSLLFDVDELNLRNQMRPNNSKIRGVWDESRKESREVSKIIESILKNKRIESQKLKYFVAIRYVRQSRPEFFDDDINSCISDYKNFLGEKFSSLPDSQKEIVGKLIGIKDQDLISICDEFKVRNNRLDKEKNTNEKITNEQVCAEYLWLKEICESIDLDENSKTQILFACKYAVKNEIISKLNKHPNGYSLLYKIFSMSDNDNFVVVCEDSNSFPKLKCTLKSSKGKWNFVLVFEYGLWGAELSDICFNGSIKVSDEIQALNDFKEFIEKKVEKRKNGC